MIDPSWDRWVRASINVFIETELRLLIGTRIPLYPEGSPTPKRDKNQDWVEIRLDGPRYYTLGNNEWRLTVEINLLVNSLINEANIYRHRDIAGKISKILSKDIPIKKYGTDDTYSLGCLRVGNIDSHYYDRAGQDTPLKQVTIDCFGVIELTGV